MIDDKCGSQVKAASKALSEVYLQWRKPRDERKRLSEMASRSRKLGPDATPTSACGGASQWSFYGSNMAVAEYLRPYFLAEAEHDIGNGKYDLALFSLGTSVATSP